MFELHSDCLSKPPDNAGLELIPQRYPDNKSDLFTSLFREGEIRRHEWGTVNTLTAEDSGMLADLVCHQRMESGLWRSEMGLPTEQAGEQGGFFIRVPRWDKFK